MIHHAALLSLLAVLPPDRTGDFYVSSFNADRVEVYDRDGTHLRGFTAPGLDGPRGIVILPGGPIFVASQNGNAVLVFDAAEQYVTSFSHVQLEGPTGLALSPAGDELYVGSFDNDQVVVFDLDGTFQRAFGAGTGLNGPNCIAFDSAGQIFVASQLTSTVLKFSATESYMFTFSDPSLSSPMGIARHPENEILYVAGGASNNIVKFTPYGTPLGAISHPDLTGPQGVAFDDRGHLFSTSFYQHLIVEFDADEAYVQTITEGRLSIPRSVAFRPLVPGDATGDGAVNVDDLVAVITAWGTADPDADVTGDGVVGVDDLVAVIEGWG